jgi:hypothetical protein
MYNYRRKELNTRPPNCLSASFVGYQIAVEGPIFTGKSCEIFHGNAVAGICVYLAAAGSRQLKAGCDWRVEMRDAKNALRVVGMIVLGLFVFMVVAPFALKLVFGILGATFSLITFLVGLAVLLIKVAVVLAIGYLILVGIRALLR